MAEHLDAVYELMHETPLQALLLLVLFLLLLHFATTSSSKQAKRLPPSPPGLPFVGHLHFVSIRDPVSLCNLAKKYGGLMLLRLGAVRYLVVSSPRAAKAVLQTHDHLMASRPPSMVTDVLLYGSSDLVFSPYGEQWRQMKKLATTHLLSVKKVQSCRITRQQEVRLVIAKIRAAAVASTAVDVSDLMYIFANDVMCRALSGKFLSSERREKLFSELIKENTALFARFNLEHYFPRLAKVDLLTRFYVRNKGKEVNRRWDTVLETILENREEKSMSRGRDDGSRDQEEEEEESDFIDVLLSVQHEYHGITRDNIKAVLMDMFGAGTETLFFVLDVAMAELMRRPEVMVKLQAEVRDNTPKGQEMVEEEDLAGMAYLKAVVKETLRLHPPLPLLLPHLSMADCSEVDGYTIPSGTRVFVNAWAISRDPEAWDRPGEFLPERFMEGGSAAAVDFRGNDFQFVPFGAGRRICPGLNFGLAAVDILLANLVYCFDWALPAGMEKEDIDMTEVFGISVRRKGKLQLVPRNYVTA